MDRAVKAGEALHAWCGPQPNSRLLINYGIVDDDNPYDKMQARPPSPPPASLLPGSLPPPLLPGLTRHTCFGPLQITVSIPSDDPLFAQKRFALHSAELSSKSTFSLTRGEPLPERLLPFLRFAYIDDKEVIDRKTFDRMMEGCGVPDRRKL